MLLGPRDMLHNRSEVHIDRVTAWNGVITVMESNVVDRSFFKQTGEVFAF